MLLCVVDYRQGGFMPIQETSIYNGGSMSEDNQKKISDEQQDQVLFMMLVQQHQQIALMGLGKEENPSTGKTEKDLNAVKYAIDTLNMMEKYTEGNLNKEMKDYLADVLRNLRLSYVEMTQQEKSKKS